MKPQRGANTWRVEVKRSPPPPRQDWDPGPNAANGDTQEAENHGQRPQEVFVFLKNRKRRAKNLHLWYLGPSEHSHPSAGHRNRSRQPGHPQGATGATQDGRRSQKLPPSARPHGAEQSRPGRAVCRGKPGTQTVSRSRNRTTQNTAAPGAAAPHPLPPLTASWQPGPGEGSRREAAVSPPGRASRVPKRLL